MSIEEVRDRAEDSLMKLPNVIGVGIGEQGGKQVIEVLVTKKIPDAADQTIPKSIEGYPVKVVEAGDVTAHGSEKETDGT